MELKHSTGGPLEEVEVLLIVPYGIETRQVVLGVPFGYAFNCTLWN